MPIIMNMACINYKFKTNEALIAATLNSAFALKKSEEIGSLEKGKKADFLILNAKRWENIIYQLGENLIESVYWNGKKVA
jgi:imidazolonepropionase